MLKMKPDEGKAFTATPQPSPYLNVTLFINTYLHFPWENVPLLLYSDLRDVCVAGLFVYSYVSASYLFYGPFWYI